MKLLSARQLLLAVAAAAPAWSALSWKSVKLGGGGGFVPGIVFHPTTKGVAYARTDIGGLYRLNPADDSWTAVTDSLATSDQWGKWGIDAVALDPQDANKVYAATGMYTNSWDPNNGAIIRSSDKGATWTVTTLPFKVGGNMPGRGMGERLAVDPKNSNILYFGARSGNGLWKSTNAGASWAKVTSFTAVGTFVPDPADAGGYNGDNQGLAFVTFDSTSAALNGATSRIFVGTADKTTSLYVSEDAGTTWQAVAGQPTGYLPHKGKLQPTEKALYLTYSDGSGPYDGTMGSVHRYDITAKTWRDITPVSGTDLFFGFGGLGVDMLQPGTIVVATLNSWWPDAQLFRSKDSGATWSRIWEWANYPEMNRYYSINAAKAPWVDSGFNAIDTKKLGWMIEALEIDPLDSDHWLYGTGLTLYGGHDLTRWDSTGATKNVSIHVMADGIEETAVLDLASAPGGSEVFAAVGDISGFTFRSFSDVNTAPRVPWMPMFTSSSSVDFAGNKPATVVRIGTGDGSQQVAMSNDNGASWYLYSGADTSTGGGEVALSADGTIILWASANKGLIRSQNSGAFAAVSGVTVSGNVAVAADRRDNAKFYAGSAGSGTLFISTNGGSSFSAVAGSLGGATGIRDVVTHPTVGGTVFVSTNLGVFRSTDSGATFSPVATTSVSNTHRIGVGLASADGSVWKLYAFGTGSAGPRLYSINAAGTGSWEDIQGAAQGFGAVDSGRVVGSGNVAGVVYVGTNGRGVFQAQGAPSSGTGGTTTTTSRSSTTSTTSRATTLSTSTTTTRAGTTTTTTSSQPGPTGTVPQWGQCGGNNWTGPTVCVSPYKCTVINEWYHQCL